MSVLLLKIFLEFCKIGIIAFGGGNAILPILHREVVENLKWISTQDLLNFFSIAETTPGPIGMDLATFIGFKLAGYPGDFRPYLLSLAAFIVFMRFKGLNPIYLLIACGLIGMLCF